MKPAAAIVDNAVVRAGRKVDNALRAYTAAEANAKERRLELGRALIEARQLFPKTGRNAGGWSRFVAERGINMDVALDAMKYAGWVEEHCGPDDPLPTRAEAGLDKPGEKGSAGAGALSREFSTADLLALLEQRAPELDAEDRARARRMLKPPREDDVGDRDSWCTPPEITSSLPPVDLDPCSNERSTVRATRQCWLSRGEDGLKVPWRGSLWINGPFSDLEPWARKLVEEWPQITACGWLCNTDSTTEWWRLCVSVLPLRLDLNDRTAFVPPPGVKASSNDRPQTLLMTDSFWRGCDQAALLKIGTLWRRSGALELVR